MRFLIITLIIFSTSAHAEEPLEFKGFALGSTLASADSVHPLYCKKRFDPATPNKVCTTAFAKDDTIAGHPIDKITLYFFDDSLQIITIFFHEKYFSDIVSALTEKYGVGTVTESTIQNRMGATFDDKILIWRKGSAFVRAERYAGQIDMSSVFYQTDSSIEKLKKQNESLVKERTKDL